MNYMNLKKIIPFAIIALTVIAGVVILFLMPTVGTSVLGLEPGNFPVAFLAATGLVILSPGIYALFRKKL